MRGRGPHSLWEDPWGQMPPPPLNDLVLSAFGGKISGLETISSPRLLCDLGQVTTSLWAPVIPKTSSNTKTL